MPRTLLAMAMAIAATSAMAQPNTGWVLDELELTCGFAFKGYLVEENSLGATFRIVSAPPGRPTVTLTSFFSKAEIKKLTKLADAERKILKDRLAEFDAADRTARERLDGMTFEPAPWLGQKNRAKLYASDRFELLSAAPDDLTKRAVLRLEQVYTAYARIMPPRHPASATRIELAGTLDDYAEALKSSSLKVLNSAVYLPDENRIVCGSDLKRLGDELTKSRIHHEQQLVEADRAEKELRELYKGAKGDQKLELERFLAAIKMGRAKIASAERENSREFDRSTRSLFAVLYHEAFHSYVASSVYPPRTADDIKAGKGTGELPRWMHEGLAQLFEDPVFEAGELRVGHADPARLKAVRAFLAKPGEAGLLPLAELLRSGKDQFVLAHVNQKEMTDRAYLTSWALAYALTFDRRIVGSASLDEYVSAVNTGIAPVEAFEKLVGQDFIDFEKDWHAYLLRLQPDGTLKK